MWSLYAAWNGTGRVYSHISVAEAGSANGWANGDASVAAGRRALMTMESRPIIFKCSKVLRILEF